MQVGSLRTKRNEEASMADEELKNGIQELLDKTDLDEKAVAFGK